MPAQAPRQVRRLEPVMAAQWPESKLSEPAALLRVETRQGLLLFLLRPDYSSRAKGTRRPEPMRPKLTL